MSKILFCDISLYQENIFILFSLMFFLIYPLSNITKYYFSFIIIVAFSH